jgi:hypothetical protein
MLVSSVTMEASIEVAGLCKRFGSTPTLDGSRTAGQRSCSFGPAQLFGRLLEGGACAGEIVEEHLGLLG